MRRFVSLDRKLTLTILIVIFSLSATSVYAQLSTLYNFGNRDLGTVPYGTPATDGTYLYGTTQNGGANGFGVIYKIKTDGSSYTVLHDFGATDTDGRTGIGALLYDGGVVYGTTYSGGDQGNGTIFKINPDGSGYTVMYSFTFFVDGGSPYGLTPVGSYLYGMTNGGGSSFNGTVYRINKDGTDFLKMVDLSTNGKYPQGDFFYDTGNDMLYGYGFQGGSFNDGTIFKLKPDGTVYQSIYTNFAGNNGRYPIGTPYYDGTYIWGVTLQGGLGAPGGDGVLFRIDPTDPFSYTYWDMATSGVGATPMCTLISDGPFLYGTTNKGGTLDGGTVFKFEKATGIFTKLYDLDGNYAGQAQGTLTLMGSTLYGTNGTGGTANQGSFYKVDTDGSNGATLKSLITSGFHPTGSMSFDGTYFYGTTNSGGQYNFGTVYKVKPDGTAYEVLVDFQGTVGGEEPLGSIFYHSGALYGMTQAGGANHVGTVYKVQSDGSGFTTLYDFKNTDDGNYPQNGFAFDGTFLYGMTYLGIGTSGNGTIFKISTTGTGYTKLLEFDADNNGAIPSGDLIYDGTTNYLYGMASGGGTNGEGTLFRIRTDGSGFDKLLDFDYSTTGSSPGGTLYSDGTYLYGGTTNGGAHGNGTIFRIKNDGSGFQLMHDFSGPREGAGPVGTLFPYGGYLYGITPGYGVYNKGTIYRIKPDGTSFAVLSNMEDGSNSVSSLYIDGTFIYGITPNGGKFDNGTLFRRPLTPFAKVTGFYPEQGIPGTYVTIQGTEFDPVLANNEVKFNGVLATLISADENNIIAMVPDGASDGLITVKTPSNTDASDNDFNVDDEITMFHGIIKTCDATLGDNFDYHDGDVATTLIPDTPGRKMSVTFSSITIGDDLIIYDGPDVTSPVLIDTRDGDIPHVVTSSAPGGELTLEWIWEDEGISWDATIECVLVTSVITIDQQPTDTSGCEKTVTLHTEASGASGISYQWQFSNDGNTWNDINDDNVYSGTQTSDLSVKLTTSTGAGMYRCHLNASDATQVTTDAATLTSACSAPVIGPSQVGGIVGGIVTLELGPTIADVDGDIDLTTLTIAQQPQSGAIASLDGTLLKVDYTGSQFIGTETVSISVCDKSGLCTTQVVTITIASDLIVYNAVSPNGDDKNEFFMIEYIDILPSTKDNVVKIFNRWGDEVFSVNNYNNTDRVFNGNNKNGNKLPSGVYYYKISFASGNHEMTGYLELKY